MNKRILVIIMDKNISAPVIKKVDLLKEMTDKGIYIIILYGGDYRDNKDKIELLEKNNIKIINYKEFDEIEGYIKDFYDENKDKLYVHTGREQILLKVNKLRKNLGLDITEPIDLFINKKKQRELLIKNNKSLTINFKEIDIDKIDITEVEKEFNYPFVIKPISGASSKGVNIINNRKEFKEVISELKIINEENKKTKGVGGVIIEEFIEGQMYTVDYFVNEKGEPIILPFIKSFTVKDIYGVEDFGISREILGKSTLNDIPKEKFINFIKDTIKALNIKNTYIHQEFKVNNKGEMKVIEINGRIGGLRGEMYSEVYNINVYILPFISQSELVLNQKDIDYNYLGLLPLEEKNKNYLGINKQFIEKLEKLDSFDIIKVDKKKIGKKVGFARNGHTRLGYVFLKNKDLEKLEKDYNFFKNNYPKAIIYEE